MRQKLITVDEESFGIAKRMLNFSAWVRMALKATVQGGVELVNPSELDLIQCLGMAQTRLVDKYGFDDERTIAMTELFMAERKAR